LPFFADDGIVVVEAGKWSVMPARYRVRRVEKKRSAAMTTAEYLQTPETVLPRELAFGVLRAAEAPRASHQRVVLELLLAIAPFVRERHLGEVLPAPIDVILDFDEGLVVQPDLVFVSSERREIVGDQINGAPDLVVDVLSPQPRVGRLEQRVGWFARYGVRECWVANLVERKVAVLRLATGGVRERELFSDREPIRSEVLSDLAVTPKEIFGL
jgi:Uma2 family endonuclease